MRIERDGSRSIHYSTCVVVYGRLCALCSRGLRDAKPPWASLVPRCWLVAPGAAGGFASLYGRQGSRDLDELTSRVGWRRMQGCRAYRSSWQSWLSWILGDEAREPQEPQEPRLLTADSRQLKAHSTTRKRSCDHSAVPRCAALQLHRPETSEKQVLVQ